MKNQNKRIGVLCCAIFMSAFLLTGCSTTELEERCFPMMVSVSFEDGKVTYGADFPREDATGQTNTKGVEIGVPIVEGKDFGSSKEQYESHLNKKTDYSHLKVVVIGEELLEQRVAYETMLDYLAKSEEFPRNTYVCAVEDVDDLFELKKNIPQDLGSYLEEFLKKHEEKKNRLLTLGDLIDEKENQMFILYLPYFEVEENFIEWKGYVNTAGKIWQESEVE